MTDVILVLVLVLMIGAAAGYVYKEKKRGAKCIGCPASRSCHKDCNSPGCGCGKCN